MPEYIIGAWRSLVAHLHGVQGVGGSNPLAPILLEILHVAISIPDLFHMLLPLNLALVVPTSRAVLISALSTRLCFLLEQHSTSLSALASLV